MENAQIEGFREYLIENEKADNTMLYISVV